MRAIKDAELKNLTNFSSNYNEVDSIEDFEECLSILYEVLMPEVLKGGGVPSYGQCSFIGNFDEVKNSYIRGKKQEFLDAHIKLSLKEDDDSDGDDDDDSDQEE